MKRIDATLPALGRYAIPFYKESEEVLRFLGDKELRRLDRVQHLGVASKVFTGVNHSRLEYALLQCAVINMLPRFHKSHEALALSGKVRIPGQETRISSCEELLKCWALLGNAGHAQYTYGVERSLLNWARERESFSKLLLSGLPPVLRKWGRSVIDEYRDQDFHYLLILYRISQLPKRNRLRGRMFRILGALLLPFDQLELSSSADKYKLFRLRRLFSHVRTLCIVTLDSYYSHHPVRYQISGALMNLDSLFEDSKAGFMTLLENTAAWLADEIYLHPTAVAAQKNYEITSLKKLSRTYKSQFDSAEGFETFFRNLMENGFGQPKVDGLGNIARLSFSPHRFESIFGRDRYTLIRNVESQIEPPKNTFVSIVQNPYSKKIHFDLLYDADLAAPEDVAGLCAKTLHWIARLIEANVLLRIRRFGITTSDDARFGRFRNRFLKELIDQDLYPILRNIFFGIIQYILPKYYLGVISEAIPRRGAEHIGLLFKYVRGGSYDSMTPSLDELINSNPNGCSEDRVHELKALQYVVSRTKARFALACLEKFIVQDADGNHKDDWDGLVLEVFDDHVTVSIIEAKNCRKREHNEEKSFSQLKATRGLVFSRNRLSARRSRIPGLGAVMTIRF